jgi:photosystem II stability/assembly factor-like uncharacterized protein
MLLVGTDEGVYRVPVDGFDDADPVLESEGVLRVYRAEAKCFAATHSGLFRSVDGGTTWGDLGVPRREVYSVRSSPDGESLYAGTHPSHLYVSADNGRSWAELDGLQELPSRADWRLPRHRNESHVRSLGIHPDAPERLVVGIEVGGVHVSDDAGATWSERREGVHNDIHHLLVQTADSYIASCGGGLYRTRDAGRTWTRLDADLDHMYFREAFSTGDRLYAAAARSPPPSWGGPNGPDAALFESTDGGDTFETVSYPGGPEAFVLAFAGIERSEAVVAGTSEGTVLRRVDGEWTTIGQVPSTIRSLSTAPTPGVE